MKEILKLENFNYEKLHNINFTLYKNDFITLVGPNNSGKHLFLETIKNSCNSNATIIGKPLLFDKKVIDVFDEIVNKKLLDVLIKEFSIKEYLNSNYNELSITIKKKITLIKELMQFPDILIIDNYFVEFTKQEKNKILNVLHNLNTKDLTIVLLTYNLEESLYSNRIVVMDNNTIIMNDFKENIFKREKELFRLGIENPFMVDLSLKLSFYSLIDKIIYNMDEMIETLWK